MDKLFDIINIPFSYILRFIADMSGGNFAVAVFVFTLLINLAFIPLTIKSQKSAVQQMRIKPKLDALREKCGDDKQKYSMEMQELYQKEGVSMGGGCLPMLLRLVVMMSIYWLIMSPVTYLSGVEKAKVNNVNTVITESFNELKKSDKDKYDDITKKLDWSAKNVNNQLGIIKIVRDNEKVEILKDSLTDKQYGKIEDDLQYMIKKDKEAGIKFSLFGIDLTATPKFSIDIFNAFNRTWIMPLLAFAAQMLTSVMSSIMQKKQNPDAPSMMGMLLMMPLMSLFIGFGFPCGVTFYWACSSLIGGVIQILVQQFYGPHKLLSKERAKQLAKQCDFESAQISKLGAVEK